MSVYTKLKLLIVGHLLYNGVWDKAPEAGLFLIIFVLGLKVTLHKVTFYRAMQR